MLTTVVPARAVSLAQAVPQTPGDWAWRLVLLAMLLAALAVAVRAWWIHRGS